MRRFFMTVWVFLGTVALSHAACVTANKANLTQEQINLVPVLAYQVAVATGHNERPTVTETGTQVSICFNTFNPAGVITLSTMQTAYTALVNENQAQATTEATNRQDAINEWQTKLEALGFSANAMTFFLRELRR